MGILTELLRPRTQAYINSNPSDERNWSAGASGISSSGMYVTPESALQASPVWACVRLLAETLAMLPVIMYRRLADGGKERAPEHPLYGLLHDAPNSGQTAFAFKRLEMVHALLYGNAYAEIVPGPRGPVDGLTSIHPSMVRVEVLPGGGVRYKVRRADGTERVVLDEDMFHLAGLSANGVEGLSLVQYARESIGLQLAAEGYAARFYSQNARPGGVLETDKKLDLDDAEKLRNSWQKAHAGLGNAHSVAVLEQGVTWKQIGMTNEDAQLIAQLDWSAADVARFFNVPLHMIQLMTKTTSWGSGIEEMSMEFVTYSLLPWIRNWEDTIRKDLIVANRTYFAEFLLEGLLRGKLADRYSAYSVGRMNGWLNVNEIRRLENMNPIGPEGDTYLQALNMTPVGTVPTSSTGAHYALLLQEAAARIVRKEIAAMERAHNRCGGQPEPWEAAVAGFYGEHAHFVATTLHIPLEAAEGYARAGAAALVAGGIEAAIDWEATRTAALVALTKEYADD